MLIKEGAAEESMTEETDYETVEGETCPFCHQKTLTLMEARREIPFFGVCYLFSMNCSNCKYHKADVESQKKNMDRQTGIHGRE
jgi:C4-type Zn-finger protein